MDSTREERMQQRLRGAQRQVKDVDFGFILPALAVPPVEAPAPVVPDPLPEASANPETPQPDLPSQPRSQAPATASRSRGRPSNILDSQSNNVGKSNTGNDANTSAKRRKLETGEPPSSSTRSMRSSRSSARKSISDMPENDEQEQIEVENLQAPVAESLEGNASGPEIVTTAPTAAEMAIESIETYPSNEMILASDNEELAETVNQSLQEEVSLPSANEPDSPKILPPRPSRNKRKRDDPSSGHSGLDQSTIIEAASVDTTDDSIEEVPPKPPRRSRRKSALRVEVEDNEEEIPEDSIEQAEAINDYEAAIVLKKSRRRRVSRNVVASDESILEDEAPPRSPIAKKKRGRVRQITSPVQQRQPAPPKAKANKSDKKKNKAPKVREGSPIPVTVHRLTKGPVYDDDDSDADILNTEIPCATRAGVNSVDVLSQICQELVTAGLETLGDNAVKTQDAAQRLEYKTKIRAVESFSKELQVRLLEHTINLDNSYSLEKRLREVQRKKLSLREQILRVRAKREKVALQMDEIRITHEKDSQEAEQREVLNTTVHDIELAVGRGKSSSNHHTVDGKTNIELTLKRVASEASSASDGGGILKQIKAFNSFMERAALALEGRKTV